MYINATFDGDEITVRFVFIKTVADALRRFNVREAALDINEEGKYSHAVGLPQPTAMMWGNYLRQVDKVLGK